MTSSLQATAPDHLRQIQRIQTITIGWMSIEAGASLWSAWRAKSPALLAFGGDSAIELLSAATVLWRFRTLHDEDAERWAARIAGILLLVLAAFVAAASAVVLLGYSQPKPSLVGIAVLIAATAVMPWLARQKRRLSSATGSAALRADAAESMLCAYLSLIALIGLGANAFFRVTWADPIAALLITPLVIWEAREAIRGRACGCC
jgi:divalent metal cation (Fe/Co/Zn/Cd) transporter